MRKTKHRGIGRIAADLLLKPRKENIPEPATLVREIRRLTGRGRAWPNFEAAWHHRKLFPLTSNSILERAIPFIPP